MRQHNGSVARWAGLLAGCLAGLAFIAAGRMPEGRAASGVELAISARPATELGVSPAGLNLLQRMRLERGGPPARGLLTVTNYTEHAVTAGVRASGEARDLDDLVEVAVSTRGTMLFTGRLGELRRQRALELRLGPRRSRVLAFRAWLPSSVRRGFQGRAARLDLELTSTAADRR